MRWFALLLGGGMVLVAAAWAQDAYEPDDARTQSAPFIVDGPGQHHTLHSATDEDWVYFDAIRSYPYSITAGNVGQNLDVALTVYSNETPYQVLLHVDDEIGGIAESLTWIAPSYGRFYVQVSGAGPWPEEDFGYDLRIYKPLGLQPGQAEVLSSTKIHLKWSPSGQADIQGFAVRRSAEMKGPYPTVHEVPAETTAAVDAGLIPSTTYFYLIDEIDAAGNRGQLTAPVPATTLSATDEIPDFTGDGRVDAADLIELLIGLNGMDQKYDLNRDENRDYKDLFAFGEWWMIERS